MPLVQKGEVYTTQKDREVGFVPSWHREAGTPSPPWHRTPEWKQAQKPKIQQENVITSVYGRRTWHQGAASKDDKLDQGTGNPSGLADVL